VTAVVLIAAVVIKNHQPERRARAALQYLFEQTLVEETRQYRVVVDRDNGSASGKPVTATLYVQGTRRFAFCYPVSPGTSLWIGNDGEQSWLVPPEGPVLVTSDPASVQRWFGQAYGMMPLLSFRTILSRMRDRYDVELVKPLDQSDARATVQLEGRRKTFVTTDPARIRIWSSRATGAINELDLDWRPETSPAGFRRVGFLLISSEPHPETIFSHAAYHESDRPVETHSIQLNTLPVIPLPEGVQIPRTSDKNR
jgi:hypothetical protein